MEGHVAVGTTNTAGRPFTVVGKPHLDNIHTAIFVGPRGATPAQGYIGVIIGKKFNRASIHGVITNSDLSESIDSANLYFQSRDGNVGIGIKLEDTPKSRLHVNGEIQVDSEERNCNGQRAGAIRFNGSTFEGCNGADWKRLDNP